MESKASSPASHLLQARRVAFVLLLLSVFALGAAPVVAAAAASRAATAATTRAAVTRSATIVAVSAVPNSTPSAAATSTPATATAPAAAATAAPATSRTLNVPIYYQVYTLSCEESALGMALASEGVNVTDTQVLQAIGTDTRAAYYDSSGLRWGDPYTTFVGNPSGSETNLTGYGTYYPTIAAAATALGGKVLAAGEGITPATVYANVLAGHPVVTWVTWQWAAATRHDYVAFDGRVIPYAGPVEHAVTVVGVTATDVIVNDPDLGRTVVSKSLFEARYATYNDMAVVLS
jgi:uncharacterized protein YvpB